MIRESQHARVRYLLLDVQNLEVLGEALNAVGRQVPQECGFADAVLANQPKPPPRRESAVHQNPPPQTPNDQPQCALNVPNVSMHWPFGPNLCPLRNECALDTLLTDSVILCSIKL
jgi:hypothetical protein